MWERWEQRYSDHLPLDFNSLHLYHLNSSNNMSMLEQSKATSIHIKSQSVDHNFFIGPRGASENMFEVKHIVHLKVH